MSQIFDELSHLRRDQEKTVLRLPALRSEAFPEEPGRSALISASLEVKELDKIYRTPVVRLIAFGMVLVAGMIAVYLYRSGKVRDSFAADDLTVFEGTMQPVSEVKIAALEPGIVNNVDTHVGDEVRQGDLLIRLDSHAAEEAAAQARLNYETLQQDLVKMRGELAETEIDVAAESHEASQIPSRQVRDSVQHAQAVYAQAVSDYRRSEALFKDGIIAGQVFENSATALRIAKDDLDNAEKNDSASQAVRRLQARQKLLLSEISERDQDRQLREARLAVRVAAMRVANTEIRATSSGVISAVSVRVGDQVPVGATMLVISRTDRITVNVPVAATLIASLHRSQQARVTLPTAPPKQVLGRVRAISPIPGPNMTHNVEVEFDNPGGQLLVGQPAQVRFLVE